MNILITGGAGYIGSHILKSFKDKAKLIVIDNLSTGNKWAVDKDILFYEGDIGDQDLLDQVFSKNKIDSIIHLAASIDVNESVNLPLRYYQNNSCNTLLLLKMCLKYKVRKFIFSSTAAVYGQPDVEKINENTPLLPINAYGNSKMMAEKMITDFSKSDLGKDISFRFGVLRYFNVAGASADLTLGQASHSSKHLVTMATKAACGKIESLQIFGNDYDTADGTCIRDYVHVEDLVVAHEVLLESLDKESGIYNCGSGIGFSVLQVVNAMKNISDFEVKIYDRRRGDLKNLVADITKIKSKLSWSPTHDLNSICKTAYLWEQKKAY